MSMLLLLEPDLLDFLKAFNQCNVRYLIVGGASVILHGYARTTVDLDIWVDRTEKNYLQICRAFSIFGMPLFDMDHSNFFENPELDVFTFGRPPACIDLMVAVKGLSFAEAYPSSVTMDVSGIPVQVISRKDLIKAKLAAGRHKDLDDAEHLSKMENPNG